MASTLAESLHTQELDLWAKIQGISQTAADEKRSFTVEEQRAYDDMHADLDKIDARLKDTLADEKRMKESSDAYNEFSRRPSNPGFTPAATGFEAEMRSFAKGERRSIDVESSESRIIRRLSSGRPMSPYEVRVLTDAYVAGGTPGSFTNNTGAAIVPIDFYDQLISYLIEVSGIMQTGPTVLNTTGGEPIQVPVVQNHTGLTTAGAAVSVSAAQSATLATADPGFAQKTLTANKFGILIQVARELIDDSGVNLLGYLAMSAGRAIGNALGNALINGGQGISGGLISSAPIAVTGGLSSAFPSGTNQVAGGPSYTNLIDMEYSVIAPYRQSRSTYWLAADKTLGSLRKLTDTVGRPLWEPSTVLGSPDLLLGKPLVADPFMPALATAATSIAFGDFSQYFVRMVGGVRFERSDDFAFGSDLVSFRAIIRADGNLMNPPSVIAQQPIQLFKGGAS